MLTFSLPASFPKVVKDVRTLLLCEFGPSAASSTKYIAKGYKINAQKSVAFLYTNDEKSERENKETLPFIIAKKRIKYLEINLPKETSVQKTIRH